MRWLHYSCAQAHSCAMGEQLQPPVCQHWLRTGKCMYGDSCFYEHPTEVLQRPQVIAYQCANTRKHVCSVLGLLVACGAT